MEKWLIEFEERISEFPHLKNSRNLGNCRPCCGNPASKTAFNINFHILSYELHKTTTNIFNPSKN